jgi:hypothetical protein
MPITSLVLSMLLQGPGWRDLPIIEPAGEPSHTGSFIVKNRESLEWRKPRLAYNSKACVGRKRAQVIVLIYDPILRSEQGKGLGEVLKGTDPEEASRTLADVVREASWGYINYEIVDVIRVNSFPKKVDGFRYNEASYLEARKTKNWQPATSSYRAFFEENGLLDRFNKEEITELWVWGADGFHFDEFAMFIPNRYARFGPTDNPWLYRPYDIPPELDRTTWVMGFNIEVGFDNAIHSYAHRVESMAALALADGVWNTQSRRDPWNLFTFLELDHPAAPSQVGNCHCPPNGQAGYDYNNRRRVDSWAWNWWRYPDLRGKPQPISANTWGNNQFGYMKWLLERVPKFPGETPHGYNNWWVYIANVDEELPDLPESQRQSFEPPAEMPAPAVSK